MRDSIQHTGNTPPYKLRDGTQTGGVFPMCKKIKTREGEAHEQKCTQSTALFRKFPTGSRCGNLRIDNMIFYPYSRFYAFVAYYKDNACKIQQQRLWCVKTILQACTLSALVISCTYTGYFVYCLASTTTLIGIAKHQRDSVLKVFCKIRKKFDTNSKSTFRI